MIIDESIKYYKINVKFNWFHPHKILDVEEREGEFAIQRLIVQKWAFGLLQKILNFRDQMKFVEVLESGAPFIESDII
jgi:hypothetical protein